MSFDIFVPGPPGKQGSVRAMPNGRGGVRVAPADANVGAWRATVAAEVRTKYRSLVVLDGAVAVWLDFWLPRPNTHFRGKDRVLRDDAPPYPIKVPDVDKVLRATFDALTYAGVWKDDAQVVHEHTSKHWAHEEQPPGTRIEWWPL